MRLTKTRGFTLVEIMIVVFIIGILLAIAVPNFFKARDNSRARTCVSNLLQIQSAKEQAAMEKRMANTDTPNMTDLAPDYMKQIPECPAGGTYSVNPISEDPTCSLGGKHVLDQQGTNRF